MDSDAAACEHVFDCTQCGDCCRGFGGTYITESDISAICEYTAIDREAFLEKYCVRSGSRRVLRQRQDGYCIFWEKLCTIHPVKPHMCRQWPFLKSVLIDEINWRSMGSMCPGIRMEADMDQVRACIKACIQTGTKTSSKS